MWPGMWLPFSVAVLTTDVAGYVTSVFSGWQTVAKFGTSVANIEQVNMHERGALEKEGYRRQCLVAKPTFADG